MRKPKTGIGDEFVMSLAFLFFSFPLFAQPWSAPGYNYSEAPALVELAKPDAQKDAPLFGLFDNDRQASNFLCIAGSAAMLIGSVFDGMAAKKATLYGTRDGNTGPYHSTRFFGRTLQLSGASAYAVGWSLRKDRRCKGKWLEGIGEAALLFCANSLVSQAAYSLHRPGRY